MASSSGTFTGVNEASGTLYLRPQETVRVTLTFTGTATVALQQILGLGAAFAPLLSFTATTAGTDWKNESRVPIYVRLYAVSLGGGSSVVYTVADVSGDQVLQEWRAADGTLVAQITDEGISGLFVDQVSVNGTVNVKDPTYGAVGDGVTDDSAAIHAAEVAAGAGGCLIFPEGIYQCVGLTSSANAQKWIGYGQVILRKNGNGVILAHDGDDFYAENIQFRGDAASPTYTGHNLVLSGDNPKLSMCGSRYAYDRAVLATGNHVQIIGTNDIYHTATGAGYDIEIGVSGTATLYHQIYGVYSSQATGGIKFVDTGSHVVSASQFGKYWVDSGTSPAGVNGGMVTGSRILGAVQIDISNSIIVGNQFGSSATIDYASGTSGHEYWGNADADGVVTNAGNPNNAIVRQVGDGADGTIRLRYGDDSSAAVMGVLPNATGTFYFPQVEIPNNVNYRAMRASPNQASAAWTMGASASDNFSHSVSVGSHQSSVASGQAFQRIVNSVVKDRLDASGFTLGDGTTSASPGGVSSDTRNVKATASIGNAAATTVATITIPNAAHSATIRFTVVGSLGAGGAIGANEASAANSYYVTVTRTAGVNAVAAISSAFGAAASAVAGAATVTAAVTVAAVSGAVGATNTFPVQVTVARSGGSSTNHTAVVFAEVLNANAVGVSIA